MTPIPVTMMATVGAAFTAALTSFFTAVLLFVPNLIAALVTLIVGYLVVRVIVKGLGIGMRRMNLDAHVNDTEAGRFLQRSGQGFTGLVTSIVKWLLYLVVTVYAVSVLGIAPLTLSMLAILGWLPSLVAAGMIVFAGALIASYAGNALGDTLANYGVGGGTIIGLGVKLLIYALTFNFALIQLGFGGGILYMTSTAAAWGLAAALAIGIGVPMAYSLKEVLPPMVSGATTVASTLKEGQEISVEGIPNAGDGSGRVTGTVRAVGVFNTVIERGGAGGAGTYMILPNDLLMDRPILVKTGGTPALWESHVRRGVTAVEERSRRQETGGADRPSQPGPAVASPGGPAASEQGPDEFEAPQ